MKDMRNIYRILGALLFVLIVNAGFAQHRTPYNLYTQNRILLNPANTGDYGQAFVDVRNQWTTVAASPETYTFGVQSPIGKTKNMGLGLLLRRDEYGVFQRTSGTVNYSYNVAFNDDNHLAFGLGAGFVDNRIPWGSIGVIESTIDGSSELAGVVSDYKGVGFNGNFGLKYNWKDRLEISAGLPQFFEDGSYDFHQDFFGLVSYKFLAIRERMVIEPSVLFQSYTYNDWNTNTYDFNLFMCWDQTVWAGASYRGESPSFILSAGVNFFNVGIGYAYQHSMEDDIKAEFGGTHEITVRYFFNKGKDQINDELLNNDQIELAISDSITDDDYQNQIDSLKKEIETMKMLLQVKDLKDWADGFKDKIKEYQEKIDNMDGMANGELLGIHVLFDEDKHYLKEEYHSKLDAIAQEIIKTGARIEVVGHTNNNGSEEYNQVLSEKRANVVAEYLISKGVSRDNLIIVGQGQRQPIVENNTPKGKRMNRRVQFRQL